MNFDAMKTTELADMARAISNFQDQGVNFSLTYQDRFFTLTLS